MPTTVSSVEHVLCVIIVIIMTVLPTRAPTPMSSPSPLLVTSAPLPSSLPLQPVEKPLQIRELEHYNFPPEFVEDYGFWNPTPYFGGGNAAPIPHGHLVEETCCDSSMPNSFQTHKNYMATEGRS